MQEVFKPNFSTSTYCLSGGILMILFIPLFQELYHFSGGKSLIITGMVFIPLILLIGFYTGIYHTISYEVYEKELILKCGPFSSKIQYKKIKKITKIEELGFSPIGLYRSSKYLLGSSYFVKSGWIKMYATNCKNVLLIETDTKRYGITPSNEEDFLRILNERLKKEGGKDVRNQNTAGIKYCHKTCENIEGATPMGI